MSDFTTDRGPARSIGNILTTALAAASGVLFCALVAVVITGWSK